MEKENFPETYAPGDEPPVLKASNALRGVGYNDCVREAYAVADRVEQHVARL